MTEYDIHKVLGIEMEAYDRFYEQYGVQLHRDSKVRPGATRVINRLIHSHQIHFVTARAEKMRDASLEWLNRHRMPMNSISLLASHDKVQQAFEFECDLFIEDRYENAIQLANARFPVI